MTDIGTPYYFAILLWVIALVVLLAQAWRGRAPVVGLGLTFWLNLATIHLLGGLIQLLPWHDSLHRSDTITGFELTGYAMGGLLMGNVLLAPLLFARLPSRRKVPTQLMPTRELAILYIMLGLVVNFLVARILRSIPSLAAALTGGLALATAGFCLWWWYAWSTGRRKFTWLVVATSVIMPTLTLLLQGMLGYGIFALSSFGFFVAVFYKPRWVILVLAVAGLVSGLTLFPAYLTARLEIRRAVWGNQAFKERIQVASSSLEESLQWLDSREDSQLDAIEDRLNQNFLVGAASRNLQNGNARFANGETLGDAFLSLIPRILWPNKPYWAGSGDLVTRYTGIHWARGTSVGIGYVMELYVNFGEIALLLGFMVFGAVLRYLDAAAGMHLAFGAADRFVFWFVIGQSLLAVGGNLAEMAGSTASFAILCAAVNRFLAMRKHVPQSRPRSVLPVDSWTPSLMVPVDQFSR